MAGPGSTQLQCDCGSTYFFKYSVEQFLAGGYGSAEFRSTSNAPKTVLVCLCGKPFPSKPMAGLSQSTVAGQAERAFQASIQAAQKRRDEMSLQHVAEISASPSEVKQLKAEIDQLRSAFNQLSTPVAPQPKETTRPARKKLEKSVAAVV